MNLKSKIFGTLAAATVALSMMGGVVSAQSSATVNASASLAGGACSVSMTTGSSVFFGDWVWNGSAYVENGSNEAKTLTANVKSGNPSHCKVTVTFAGLANQNNTAQQIGLVNFTASGYGQSVNLGDYSDLGGATGLSHQPLPTGVYTFALDLVDVPDTVMPATYSGAIVVGVQNVQN